LAACGLVLACVGAWALTICRQCGHEAAVDATDCGHCGAAVPVTVPDAPARPETDTAEDRPVADWARELATEDLAEARQLHEAGEFETARLFCRNALALNLLTKAGPEQDIRAARIMAMIEACEQADLWEQAMCDVCGGRQGQCRRCGGSGRLRRRQTIDERKYRRGQALQRYRLLQQGRMRIATGEVWVPAAFAASLSVRDRVALRRATASGCRACMGFGRADCRTCSGAGVIPCRAAGCEQGVVTVTREGLGGSPGLPARVACTRCQGLAVTGCEPCGAAGNTLCGRCDGSGLPDGCRRCGGDGFATCGRCRGTGEVRGQPCGACRREGVEVCRTCGGTGYRS